MNYFTLSEPEDCAGFGAEELEKSVLPGSRESLLTARLCPSRPFSLLSPVAPPPPRLSVKSDGLNEAICFVGRPATRELFKASPCWWQPEWGKKLVLVLETKPSFPALQGVT